MFRLDPAFEATSKPLVSLALSEARLQDDARFPWLVLIPRLEGAVELDDLGAARRVQLLDEILAASQAVRAIGETLGRPIEKLNIGQLGNITRQLHVHIVGRRQDDPCWPGPVWGQGTADTYAMKALETARAAAVRSLAPSQLGQA